MKRFKIHIHIAACSLVCCWLVFFQAITDADDYIGETIDCTNVSINFIDDLSLTPEERIRLMDDAFFESLNRFELCEAAKKMAASSGEADDNGTPGGGKNSQVNSSGSSTSDSTSDSDSIDTSVAGSVMSGTQTPKTDYSAEEDAPKGSDDLKNAQDINKPGKNEGDKTRSNGKLPEDIPSAQNDDALAAQIRYAAENEKDPSKSRQLWNEYRKYKGLPIK